MKERLFSVVALSAGFLSCALLLACGSDSGNSSEESSSSSSAVSSSSVYVPPATDASAPVVISDFGYTMGSSVVYLEGTVYVDDTKDQTVTQIDSLVFGVNPGGPVVSMTGTAAGQDEVDLSADLQAKIVLEDFDSCGTFTLYITAYAKGKPVTDSLTFTKSESFCEVEVSSSSQEAKGFSSTSVKVAAQKKGSGIHAIDLDAMRLYNDIDSIAQAVSTVDIIFGVENGSVYLLTPNDVGSISDYQSIDAAGAYTGGLYDSELSVSASTTTADVSFKTADKQDFIEVYSGSVYVVTTDQYNAETKAGLFLLQFPGVLDGSNTALEASLTIWSVVQ